MVAAAVAVASLSMFGTAVPAHAATAPSCVSLSQWDSGGYSYARATNNCGSTVRVRMIWAWAFDGACTTIYSGYRLTEWRWGGPPYVSSLQSC